MIKQLNAILLGLALTQAAFAQYDGEEIDVEESNQIVEKDLSDEATETTVKKKKVVTEETKKRLGERETKSASAESPNKIYILNNSNANATNSNKPTTIVDTTQAQESTVVATQDNAQQAAIDSRASLLKKRRESMETETETVMVEKIEQSRIRDEKNRADRLFGDRLDVYNPYQPAPTQEVKGSPVTQKVEVVVKQNEVEEQEVVVTPAPAPTKKKTKRVIEETETEIAPVESDLSYFGERRSFVSLDIGQANYQGASNVQGGTALGFSLGVELPSRVSLDGRFKYSGYQLEETKPDNKTNYVPGVVRDVTQYNFGLGIKYRLLASDFSPTVGGVLSYTYRSYTDKASADYNADSTAWDAGLSVGADYRVTNNLTLGLDLTYMSNMSYSINGTPRKFNPSGTNLEEFKYSFVSFSGKFYF